ncbi:MAG: ScyD/ScyE family protein [Thermomicrobiales bacterium]|nr:ScyD/ScyE family protein [Thermomicrobiales bacterium]
MRKIPGRGIAPTAVAIATLIGLSGFAALAPAAAQEPAAPIALVASGLTNPRGMAWDAAGALYVAQAGTGRTETSVGAAASVARIEDGCPVPVVAGLPSTRGMSGAVQGPSDIAFLDGALYVLQDSQDDRGDLKATFPNGVYAATAQGGVRRVAGISAWMDANAAATIPYDRGKLGETYAMLTGDGFLWVVESNEGQILRVTPDGSIARVADLSDAHPVPTGIAPAPDGGVYVANLTTTPYPAGAAHVVHISPTGDVATVWTGLTMVAALAVGDDGALYALELSTDNSGEAPYIRPGSGRVVAQTGPDTLREVATGLDFPIGMTAGPDGALYVSSPAMGSDGPAGAIVRIDPHADAAAPPDDLYAAADCPGYQEARAALVAQLVQMTPPQPTPEPAATPQPAAVQIDILHFAFNPPALTIEAGTTVTWTNHDLMAHTAIATDGAFSSGYLSMGESFSFTFTTPGTYTYFCTPHPYMTGVIVVA